MGIRLFSSSSIPRRAYYPSGPWINGVRPAGSEEPKPKKEKKKKEPKLPNPDPANYNIVKAQEIGKFLLIEIHYPDCTNFEGKKVLLFKDTTLINLVNQKFIDPHFFQDKKYASPIARFVPTPEGWDMALKLIAALNN